METPQEIEVWYVIPALRRELSKTLVSTGLTQRRAAEILGIKESAVSQYLSNKRGGDLTFTKTETEEIKHSAETLIQDPNKIMHELHRLTKLMRNCGLTCRLHKKKNPELYDCDACID